MAQSSFWESARLWPGRSVTWPEAALLGACLIESVTYASGVPGAVPVRGVVE